MKTTCLSLSVKTSIQNGSRFLTQYGSMWSISATNVIHRINRGKLGPIKREICSWKTCNRLYSFRTPIRKFPAYSTRARSNLHETGSNDALYTKYVRKRGPSMPSNPMGGDSLDRSTERSESVPTSTLEFGQPSESTNLYSTQAILGIQDPLIHRFHQIASKLPSIPSRVIEGHRHRFRPQKMAPEEISLFGEVVKALDSMVTRNIPLTASLSLDLLRIVQAFPDQMCQWSNLHVVEPRTRSAQLWPLGVLQALARLQHPRTIEAWRMIKESDIQLSIGNYVELCHYFSLPSDSFDTHSKGMASKTQVNAERASQLQSVLQHAKATGNSLVILTCWNHTIQGLLAQGDIVGAEREWHALLRLNVPPQIELLQSFIRYYSKHVRNNPKYAEKVAALHSRIKLLNLSPDLQTYTEILKCYERSMHYKEMDAVLLEMTQEELKLHSQSQLMASTTQVSVKGPRATLLRESDFETDLDWPDSSEHPISATSHTISHRGIQSRPNNNALGKQSKTMDDPLHGPFNSSSIFSPTISSNFNDISANVVSNHDDQDQMEDKPSIEDLKTAAMASAQASSKNNTHVKVGQMVYTGGAQWVGGGRKQPTKAKMLNKIQSQLLPHSIATTHEFPASGFYSPSKGHLDLSEAKHEDTEVIQRQKNEHLAKRRAKVVLSWSRAIYHALSLGSLRKAMYLVEQMELLGFQVNDRICTEFMYYAGKHHDLRLLRAWWQRLREIPDYNLLKKHYLILMRELLRMDEAKEARKVMADLCASFGHFDDAYALWLRFYAKKGLYTSVESTLKQMDSQKVEYGVYSISALMELFAKRGNVQEMLIWLERLKTKSRLNHRTIDDVVSKCIYHFLNEKHTIQDPKIWLDNLPGSSDQYPRILGALMTTLGHQGNLSALEHIASLCNGSKSTHALVGLIRGYSYVPSSPKRDHTVMEIIRSCSNAKYQLSVSQMEDILEAFISLEMPLVLLDWQEDLVNHPHHVTEPSSSIFKLLAQASLAVGAPERFVEIASRCFSKHAIAPPAHVASSVIRAVCATRDVNRIMYVASPLVELYSNDPVRVLMALEEGLIEADIQRPPSVPAPTGLANPSTLDIPAYIAKRLHLSK